MKILTVIGARPQFIKASSLSREIALIASVDEVIVHTGQHYDSNMSDVFFQELDIPKPTYSLGIGGGSHGSQTGEMLIKIEEVILKEKPDYLLVYGDTNSTLAGALASSKLNIPVIHIEAGLRSFNMRMPEEQNRILTDHISELLFTPTTTGFQNLLKEGIKENKIFNVGDIMYDGALFFAELAKKKSLKNIHPEISGKNYFLCTIHRAENTDDSTRLISIFDNLNKLAKSNTILLPLHPRTKKSLEAEGLLDSYKNINFIEPLGYLDMVLLESNASLIITDSGGVQKEAYFHGVPCLTLRDETEWTELIDNGWNQLVTDFEQLEKMVSYALKDDAKTNTELYGKGNTAHLIINYILSHYNGNL
jgi:UDP-GlcNAc3NAcA epimerase